MKLNSLYTERNSIIHNLGAITKIVYIIMAISIPMIAAQRIIDILMVCCTYAILSLAKVFKKVIPMVGFSLFVLVTVFFIQGLYYSGNQTPVFKLAMFVFYQEGLSYASGICLQVLNILGAFAILVLTTKPADLIEALVQKGLSPRFGYVFSSVLQIIPQMLSSMDTIMDAQRSRGMETEGSLFTRVKAFFPLLGPVVMSSLLNVRERAMALEVRGFNSKIRKTFLNEQHESRQDKFLQGLFLLLIALVILWRVLP